MSIQFKEISNKALLDSGWKEVHTTLEKGELYSVVYTRHHPHTTRKRFILTYIIAKNSYVFEIFVPGLIRRKKLYTGFPSSMQELYSMFDYN